MDELQSEVAVGIREDQFAAEERRAKRGDGQYQQEQNGHHVDAPGAFPRPEPSGEWARE